MFEPAFLGQVPIRGMGQSQGQPSPSSSDARFAVPAADQNFVPTSLSPFVVPFVSGWAYPPQYPPDRFDCVLQADGLSWICTPRSSAPAVPVALGPVYPVIPVGPLY